MSARSARILLVEDDEIQGEILKSLLEQQHYNVDYFLDGRSAIAATQKRQYDLAFIDIYLPDISGLDVLDNMRANPHYANTPILMMTADATEDTSVLALVKEADEVLIKPLRHSEFLLKTKLWLDRQLERLLGVDLVLIGELERELVHVLRIGAGDDERALCVAQRLRQACER